MLSVVSHTFAQVDILDYKSLSDEDKVELLWSNFLDDRLDPVQLYSTLNKLKQQDLSFSSKLRILKLESIFSRSKKDVVITVPDELTKRDILRIAAEIDFYGHLLGETSIENQKRIQKAQNQLAKLKVFEQKSSQELQNLYYNTPDFSGYKNGEYKDTLKLFLFCRHDRNFPCLIIMKDIFDQPVRNTDGTLWSIPALAKSSRNFPYSITNGQTPQGVHQMDSVMPEADQFKDFGKWRRVILNWVEASELDKNMSHFLTKQTLKSNWWRQSSIAREIGRKWLRIHGTGKKNKSPATTYFPHVPTSGCISTLEGDYGKNKYQDQRLLLDKMMESMQLVPVFTNEADIKGILYVVDLDQKKKKVTLKDLAVYGIE